MRQKRLSKEKRAKQKQERSHFSPEKNCSVLQVTLSVERGGEGHVIQSSWDAISALVGQHPSDTVLGLIGRQFATQDVGRDEGLRRGRKWIFDVLILSLQLQLQLHEGSRLQHLIIHYEIYHLQKTIVVQETD